MDKIKDLANDIPEESVSFFKFVFNFDDDSRGEILNLFQYAILAIIPIVLILKSVKHLIPEEDESKGSVELLAESVGQILYIILTLWLTNRMIKFVPTYSGMEYSSVNLMHALLPLLLIVITMQSKLGAKINLLADRVMERINGEDTSNAQRKGQQGQQVRVSQPLAGVQHKPSQADYLDQSQILPSNHQLTSMPQVQQPHTQHVQPMMEQNIPMAANDGTGGFSSW